MAEDSHLNLTGKSLSKIDFSLTSFNKLVSNSIRFWGVTEGPKGGQLIKGG